MPNPHVIRRLVGALIAGLLSAHSEAAPVVFVTPKANSSWWLSETAVSRPMGRSIDGLPMAELDKLRAATPGPSDVDKLCFVDALDPSNIVSVSRATQREIDKTIAENGGAALFKHEDVTSDGLHYVTRVGVYEGCNGSSGGIIVSYDASTKRPLRADYFSDQPLNFLLPAKAPALLVESSCFECGDGSLYYYDPARKAFYWEYVGD